MVTVILYLSKKSSWLGLDKLTSTLYCDFVRETCISFGVDKLIVINETDYSKEQLFKNVYRHSDWIEIVNSPNDLNLVGKKVLLAKRTTDSSTTYLPTYKHTNDSVYILHSDNGKPITSITPDIVVSIPTMEPEKNTRLPYVENVEYALWSGVALGVCLYDRTTKLRVLEVKAFDDDDARFKRNANEAQKDKKRTYETSGEAEAG